MMILEGYFVRGAISFGDVYIDEIAVFGPALIDAHNGEEKLARDPRIILTEEAVKIVKKHLTSYPNKEGAPQCHHLLCDSDGQWFLNYLDILLPAEGEVLMDDLIKHKNTVECKLEKHSSDPKIWSKYSWVARYHNHFCKLHPNYFDNNHTIDIDKFESPPKSIVG